VTAEIEKAGIALTDVAARLLISEYGTRIALSVGLPDDYAFTPRDGHELALRFELFNSVDGSVPFLATVGWLRFVCSNGFVVGTTTAKVRQRHSKGLNIEDCSMVLADGHRHDRPRWQAGPAADEPAAERTAPRRDDSRPRRGVTTAGQRPLQSRMM